MTSPKASAYLRNGFKRSALGIAIGMCIMSGSVHGQAVTGSIYGSTGSANSVVVIENLDTGARTEVTADASGRYIASSLPNGRYKVTANGVERDNVRVVAGQGVDVGFDSVDDSTALSTITVTGSVNAIDVTTVESKLTLTKEFLQQVPVAPNITQISLLAPGVIQGDSRYGNVAVFTGSSASENAYYINGFPVTQSLTQFGYTELPYNSIDSIQVSTGSYGVEYGRATGGVVSIITSTGSNEWKAGGQVRYRPNAWAANAKDIYYGPNGREGLAWGNAGQIAQYQDEGIEEKSYSAYVSGPIVKDRLFFYAAGEFIEQSDGLVRFLASSQGNVDASLASGWREYEYQLPRWLAKLDWNITDNHRLEFTALQDRSRENEDYNGFDYSTLQEDIGEPVSGYIRDRKTRTYIGNYTGYLTDNLTLSAMYGKSKTDYSGDPKGYNPDCPEISVQAGAEVPGLNYTTCQPATAPGFLAGRFDENKAYRLDIEWRLGDHTFKAGWDATDAESLVGSANYNINYPGALGESFAGGYRWTYYRADDPNEPIYEPQGVGSPASGGGYGEQGYYVVRNIGLNVSTPHVKQTAQYIKDSWQVTDNVLLELGLRNEQFENFASDGTAFIDFNKQLAPRFGAIWDVNGDSSLKVYGSLGRYHLALPNNVARRGVDGATNTSEAFVYTGIDPVTGAPTGLTALGPVYSPNNEFGQSRDGRSFAPKSLKSHYQDTLVLGVEKALDFADTSFNSGAKLTFSKLGSAIDDFCDPRPAQEWALAHGLAPEDVGYDTSGGGDHTNFAGFLAHCVLINPGENNTYRYDLDGDGTYENITLTRDMLKFPKLKRDYLALDFFLERPFDGTWYARVDYVWSKLKGNLEGQLNSDIGQIDVSTTLAGDYYELATYANGYLPNDRRHQLKLNGYWQFHPEFGVGGVFSYASGRPMNCRGAYPNIDPESPNYGSYHFFCDGVPVPRGTYGRLPPSVRLDLSFRYRPHWMDGLEFGFNVYNVANRQSVANINELYNQGASATTLNANWGRVQSYTAPRYAELVIRYDWGSAK